MEVTAASVLLLPFAAASVGVARRRLVSDLIAADVYDSAVCDVALVISELFSNALRHAAPLPGAKIRVAWRIDPGCVQVSVSDGGGATVPELGQPTQGATGGRGLRIVRTRGWRSCPPAGDEHAGATAPARTAPRGWAEVPAMTPDDRGRRAGGGDGERLAEGYRDLRRPGNGGTVARRSAG